MRKLKRWWRNYRGEFLIRKRRREIARELQGFLKLSAPPVLRYGGGAGHDSIYGVFDGTHQLGVLRLLNPWRERPGIPDGQPFVLAKRAERIDREWNAYVQCEGTGLTPKPLWRTVDAMLCAYLPLRSLQQKLTDAPEKAWDILCKVTPRIRTLHSAGITHMDICLANILADEAMTHLYFVDFEYCPAAHIPAAEQRLYDHLRLVESTWKFIPPDIRGNSREWFAILSECLDDEMKQADLSLLAPSLGRILSDGDFRKRLENLIMRANSSARSAVSRV